MSDGQNVIRLDEVTKRYRGAAHDPGFALAPTSLDVRAGAWTALTGRSGAGKTTLLQLMAGLDRPDSGRVTMFGRDITNDSEGALAFMRRERLGVVYQQFHFIEHLPVWQNVSCRLVPAGMRAAARRERAELVLRDLGLSGMADRLPRALSGGEQQRVALARAVIGTPDVLIADEPTSNVDAATGELILVYFRRLQDGGCSIVLTTHDPAMVSPADRHYVMEDGRLVS